MKYLLTSYSGTIQGLASHLASFQVSKPKRGIPYWLITACMIVGFMGAFVVVFVKI
jgi:hypothetical protein